MRCVCPKRSSDRSGPGPVEHADGHLFVDLRTYGKGFEKYRVQAEEQGIRLIRSRIYAVTEKEGGDGLLIRYADEAGNIFTEEYDLVVLSKGPATLQGFLETVEKLGLSLNRYGFCEPIELTGLQPTGRLFSWQGASSAPKDIPGRLFRPALLWVRRPGTWPVLREQEFLLLWSYPRNRISRAANRGLGSWFAAAARTLPV